MFYSFILLFFAASLIVGIMALIISYFSYFKIADNEAASAFKQTAKALTVEEAEEALAEGLKILEVNNYINLEDEADVSFYEDVKTLHQQLATASQLKAEGKLSTVEEQTVLNSTATLAVREKELNSVLIPDWFYYAVIMTLILAAIPIAILVFAIILLRVFGY